MYIVAEKIINKYLLCQIIFDNGKYIFKMTNKNPIIFDTEKEAREVYDIFKK